MTLDELADRWAAATIAEAAAHAAHLDALVEWEGCKIALDAARQAFVDAGHDQMNLTVEAVRAAGVLDAKT